MAIWSSIFGERQLTPPVPAQQISVSELPKELAPYYKDILSKSQALYEQRMAEDPSLRRYTGATLAEFSPEQQQAFTGIAGLVGSQAPAMAEATEMTRAGAAPITGEQIEEYMSPYQQAVTDIEKREATKQFESQVVPGLAQQAAQAQAFGGSRQAILEGMAADTQQRLLADIQAKGSAQAYQEAVRRLEEERTRTGQAASQIGNIGTAAYKGAASELGQLGIVGAAKQQQAQTALDTEYAEWLKQRQQPFREMGKYQSMVIGAPIGQTQFEPSKPATFGPSVGQQIVGGLGGLGQLYGQFSGRTLAGTPYPGYPQGTGKTGGGISSLVRRAYTNTSVANAPVWKPEEVPNVVDENLGFSQNLIKQLNLYGKEISKYRTENEAIADLRRAQLQRERDLIKGQTARNQFEREQALFKSMAKWGMSPEVTGPEGTTAGMQVSQLLSRIGSDVGEAGSKIRERSLAENRAVDDLEIKYREAINAGDLATAGLILDQLNTMGSTLASMQTAQSALLQAKKQGQKPHKWSAEAGKIVGADGVLIEGNWQFKGERQEYANALMQGFSDFNIKLMENPEATVDVYNPKLGRSIRVKINIADALGVKKGHKLYDMRNELTLNNQAITTNPDYQNIIRDYILRYTAAKAGLEKGADIKKIAAPSQKTEIYGSEDFNEPPDVEELR